MDRASIRSENRRGEEMSGPSKEPLTQTTEIDLPQLERRLRSPRTLFSACMSGLVAVMTGIAILPLFSVLFMLFFRGGQRLGIALFTELPPAAGMVGGGIGNALLGTLLVVLVATLISVPLGVLGGVFLAEISPDGRTAAAVRFCAKVLTGLPSIIAGVFAFTLLVLFFGFSPWAGGAALSLLMLPTILLTSEEAIRMVPTKMRDAALGMGATPAQTTWYVTLPTAFPGILTGVLLAVARAAGETAPLLFTMTFSDYWLSSNLNEPTASLAVLIYNFSKSPFENQKEIAWAASLVLVLVVLALNLSGQAMSRRSLVK
jgi:phosphate transport system permease protein